MPTFADPKTGVVGKNAGAAYGEQNVMSRVKLSPFEEKALADGAKEAFYIYNASPIHAWEQYTGGQFGTIIIPKAPWVFSGPLVARLSTPIRILSVIGRPYDAGDRKMKIHLDDGRDFVEGDILRCSDKYPAQDPNANLTRFGAFYLDKPFVDFKIKEQEEIFDKAFAQFEVKARQLVQSADQIWAGDPAKRNFIMPIHLAALKAVSEIDGDELKREWAPTSSGRKYKNCKFCQSRNAPEAVVCANCKEVIDQAGYDKLKAAK